MEYKDIKLGQIIKYKEDELIVEVFTFTEGRHHCKEMHKRFPKCPDECYTKAKRVIGLIKINPYKPYIFCLGIKRCMGSREATNSEILSFIPKIKNEYVREELKKLLKERL